MDIEEYTVDLLAAFVHLRSFVFIVYDDYPIKDRHSLIMKASDRVPHLEYFIMPRSEHCYKRVGGELVIYDWMEYRWSSICW